MTIYIDQVYAETERKTIAEAEELVRSRFIEVYGAEEGERRLQALFNRMADNIRSDGRRSELVTQAGDDASDGTATIVTDEALQPAAGPEWDGIPLQPHQAGWHMLSSKIEPGVEEPWHYDPNRDEVHWVRDNRAWEPRYMGRMWHYVGMMLILTSVPSLQTDYVEMPEWQKYRHRKTKAVIWARWKQDERHCDGGVWEEQGQLGCTSKAYAAEVWEGPL